MTQSSQSAGTPNAGLEANQSPCLGDLAEPGRILLLSCYELGHAPHGLAMPRAFLERAGFAPAAVDLSIERLTEAHIDRARLVAISVPMHTALRLGTMLIPRIRRRNPEARICFFGHYALLNRAYLRALGADWILAGEHEEELVRLATRLTRPGPEPDSGALHELTLAKLRFLAPSRQGLSLGRYARLDMADGRPRLCGYTETSRGCLDTCRHCPIPPVYGGRFFVIPADQVLDDIAAQVALGAEHITFGDPDFLNGPRHGMEILRRMHARFPALTFDITAQISHLLAHERYLPELAALGCAFVVSAVESLSDAVLAKLKKRHRRADVLRTLSCCEAAGLALRPTFVTFTPWTTLADVRDLLDVIAERDLVSHVDPVQLTIRLLVPPGSLLLSAEDTRSAFGPLDPAALSHTWTHPDPAVDALWRSVAALVETATRQGESPAAIFAAVRAEAYRAAGLSVPLPALVPRARKPVPRVTEPWFC